MKKIILGLFLILGAMSFAVPKNLDADKVKKAGYEITAGAKHDKAIHKETGKMIAIPRHKGDIPTGTAHNILKEAGLK